MTIIMIGMIAGLLFIMQRYLYQRFWSRSVEVKIEFGDSLVWTGEQTILTETVENRKRLPLPVLKVKFQCSGYLVFREDHNAAVTDMYYRNDLFSLMPYRRIIRKHTVKCTKRGYYGIRGIDLVGTDLFLTMEMNESREGNTYLYVIPALYECEPLAAAAQKIAGEIASKRHLTADPFAYRGIREYTPFDEVRTINWKASARTDDLKVNIYDHTSVSTVAIYMNLEDRQIRQQEDQIEKAIGIGAFLATSFLESGVSISLYANGKDCIHKSLLHMEEAHDKGQLEHLYQMLARIDLEQGTEPFDQCFEEALMKRSERMTILISPDSHKEIQDLLNRLEPSRQFMWICPCRKVEDKEIRQELKNHVLLVPDRVGGDYAGTS